ncbi:MAG: glycosyltransferase family 1 protein [Candidatus Competibacteraceae bacterium]|nr:glycosyltransferase family 1 protein [Candidatus Competibacteraceae bacterium]HRY14254.1 glycosyltransferase family 1 protein [Candidatus Competibacteraceae bacterium]
MTIEQTLHSDRARLRLGIVTETYPPEINGVALTIARWVDGLLTRGHAVQLIRVRQGPNDSPQPGDALETLALPGFRIPGYPQLQGGWPAHKSLLTHWRWNRPDLIHIVTEGPLGYSALSAARRLGIPVSTSFHTNFHNYSRHYHLGWLATPIIAYLRHFHNQGAQTLVPTQELAEQLQSIGFLRTQILARSIDTRLFSPQHRDMTLRQHWGAAPDALVVLYVGRLAAEKNLELAIVAFQAIQRMQPHARLVLVGDGPLTPRLRARHPEFVYCGMRQGHDLATHYASADLFLFPSLTETFGNVTLEALASGLAVAAFDYAAARAHVEPGRSGLLAPYADTQAFISAATTLAQDLSALRQMGKTARQVMLQLDSEYLYDRLETLFLSAIREKTPPSGATTVRAPLEKESQEGF